MRMYINRADGTLNVQSALKFHNSNGTEFYGTGNGGAIKFVGGYPNFQQLGVAYYGGLLSYNTGAVPDGGGAWSCDCGGNTTNAGVSYAVAHIDTSDARLKSNVAAWEAGLAEVVRINPVSFEFPENSGLGELGRRYHGVIAQEVQVILPEAVATYKRIAPMICCMISHWPRILWRSSLRVFFMPASTP